MTSPQTNIDSLVEFLNKFQIAKNYNSKEIRLTIQEAEQLSLGIARLLARHSVLADQVIELQSQVISGIEVSQDGGKF